MIAMSAMPGGIPYNTLVVAGGVAAVGFAAGVVGAIGLLRKRPLVADAAAHCTLAGAAGVVLAGGGRDLPALLGGAFVAALAGLGTLVLLRRFTRTRDDAATAIVIGVGFGLGLALESALTARGVPGAAGLEQFLLGHTAALTARDAVVLAVVSALVVAVVILGLKEATLVAFDPGFAAATGWPVGLVDQAVVVLVAVMAVAGLPAAGAVLVTALVVIPPAAARQWTDRVDHLVALSGVIGLAAAVAGVAASALGPAACAAAGFPPPRGLATGPLVVLAAAGILVASIVASPRRRSVGGGVPASDADAGVAET